MASRTEDELLNEAPAPPSAGQAPAAPPSAPQSGMTADQLLNETPPAPRTWADTGLAALAALKRGAEVVGSGAVRGAMWLPDLMTAAQNAAPDIDPTAAMSGLPAVVSSSPASSPASALANLPLPDLPPAPKATLPLPGDWLAQNYLAQPQNLPERLLYGGGAGFGGAATSFGIPFSSVGGALRGGAIAAASGAGAREAGDLAAKFTDNPWARFAAETVAGGLGGAATAATQGLAGGVRNVVSELRAPRTPGGVADLVGRSLNEVAAPTTTPDTIREALAAPKPAGIAPSLGDLTNDPGIMALQRGVESGDLAAWGAGDAARADNNRRIREAFSAIGDPQGRSATQISQEGAAQLKQIAQQQGDAASAQFTALPLDQTEVPIKPIMDRFFDYATGLSVPRRSMLPSHYLDQLSTIAGEFGENVPLRQLQDFRSGLLNDIRAAGRSATPNYNQQEVLNGLRDALFPEGGPEAFVTPGDAAVGNQLRNARQAWQDFRSTYSSPKEIGGVVRGDIAPEDAFSTMLGPGKEQATRVQQFLDAAQDNPELQQNARDWFSGQMLKASQVRREDQSGGFYINGGALTKFQQNNSDLIASGLFTPEQQQRFSDLAQAANTMQRTARAGTPGSDTVRNLAAGRFGDALQLSRPAAMVANTLPEAIGGALGTVGGYALGGGEFTGGVGMMMGREMGRDMGASLLGYGGVRQAVTRGLAEATRDPEFAAQLMERPGAQLGASASSLRQTLAQPRPGLGGTIVRAPGRGLQYLLASPGFRSGLTGTMGGAGAF